MNSPKKEQKSVAQHYSLQHENLQISLHSIFADAFLLQPKLNWNEIRSPKTRLNAPRFIGLLIYLIIGKVFTFGKGFKKVSAETICIKSFCVLSMLT